MGKQEQPGYRRIRKAGTHLAPILGNVFWDPTPFPFLHSLLCPDSQLCSASPGSRQPQPQGGTEALGKGLTHLTPVSSGLQGTNEACDLSKIYFLETKGLP